MRPHARKPYALIAEVDPMRAANYAALVTQLGFEPNHVRDGEAGRIALRTRGAPAILVCELALPRSDGLALIADLRQRCPPEETPVVAISAYLELRSRAWAQREALGISEVLATSATQDAILGAIRRALAKVGAAPASPAPVAAAPVQAPAIDDLPAAAFLGDATAQAELADAIATAFDVPLALLQTPERGFVGGPARGGVLDDELAALVRRATRAESVVDLLIDRVRMDHPLVKTGRVRSLAIAPITSPAGEWLGAIALFHPRRSAFQADHLSALTALAHRLAGERAMQTFDDSPSVEIVVRQIEPASLPQLLALLDHVDSGLVLFDAQRRVRFANRAAGELLVAAPEQLLGLPFDEFTRRNTLLFDDPSEYLQMLSVLADGPFAVHAELEAQRPARRVLRWVMRPVPLDGATGELCIVSDVTAQADLFAAREALVRTDSLTRLPNRIAAEEALARELARARREELPLAVALVDIDGFLRLNAAHGSEAGDELLRRVALMLEATLRAGDFVGRWGADEFVLLLCGVKQEGALIAAERVRSAMAELALGAVGAQTVSIGLACVDPEEPPESALRTAATRLAAAKAGGGNRIES